MCTFLTKCFNKSKFLLLVDIFVKDRFYLIVCLLAFLLAFIFTSFSLAPAFFCPLSALDGSLHLVITILFISYIFYVFFYSFTHYFFFLSFFLSFFVVFTFLSKTYITKTNTYLQIDSIQPYINKNVNIAKVYLMQKSVCMRGSHLI